MTITLSVTATGSAIECGTRTIALSRYSETHERLLADYGIGTHVLEYDDAPSYVQMWT